jgi:acyl carrier protein
MTPSIDLDILNRLRQCLPRLAPLLQENVPLRELALDSMDTVELLCAVDDEFGVTLTEDEFQPQHTLRDIAQTIASKTQACPL